MGPEDLCDVVRKVRSGESSAQERAERSIGACRTELAAYRRFSPDRIRAEARAVDEMLRLGRDPGAFTGALVSVKDLYGVPGYDTFAGTPRKLPDRFLKAGPVVKACLSAGAIVAGKTHTVEFAFGGIGANAHWGTPINPWDNEAHRVPGGSSAGAGVSLVEGTADVALGTDTAGSVRIPAAWTGQVGLKTTVGRWSTGGIVPLSSTLDTAGLLCRTARDLRYAFGVVDGTPEGNSVGPPSMSGLRFGRAPRALWDDTSPGVNEAVERALSDLARVGADVRDVDVPEVGEGLEVFRRGSVAGVELYAFLRRELPDWLETLEPRVGARVKRADRVLAIEYLDRRAQLRRLAAAADRRLADLGVDAVVCPTVAISPPRLDALDPLETYTQENLRALRNTSVANQLGLCALTIPAGKDALGLPVGLMLMARGGADARLVAIGEAVEAVLGTPLQRLGPAPLSRRVSLGPRGRDAVDAPPG